MRKLLTQISIATLVLVLAGFVFVPVPAHAANPLGCVTSVQGAADCIYGVIGQLMHLTIIPFLALILRLIAGIFDFILLVSLNSNYLYDSEAVNVGWRVFRDISNMFFIFILIFTGIQTILNLGSANTKRVIVNVVIAAVLVNFSLFFTKVIIDVSNVFTAWFAQGIANLSPDNSVGSSVKAVLSFDRLWDLKDVADPSKFTLALFTNGMLIIGLTCVAIYVFFNVTFFFIGRVVSFVILLITAPLGFVGFLVPKLDDYAKKWWAELKCQAMMAPMFLLLMYITLYLADSFAGILQRVPGVGVTDSVTNTSFTVADYLLFIIVAVMLQKCLEIAKDDGCAMGNKIGEIFKSGAMLATGSIAVGTLGKAANALGGSAGFQKWAAGRGEGAASQFTGRVFGGSTAALTQFTAKAGFGVKDAAKDILKAASVDKAAPLKDAFKGADKGFKGKIDEEVKTEKEIAKSLGKGLQGALNRQSYAENLKGSLYNRTMDSLGKTSGKVVGAVTGAVIGGATGGAGGVVPGWVGGGAAGAAIGAVAAKPVGAFMKSEGTAKAGKDIEDDAKKELKKESKKEAEEALNSIGGKSEDALEKELKSLELERDKVIREASEESEELAKEMKELKEVQEELVESLKQFNATALTINGQRVEKATFEMRQMEVKDRLKEVESKIERKTKELPESSFAKVDDLSKKIHEVEQQMREREGKIAEKIADMKKKGIRFVKTVKNAAGKEVEVPLDENEAGLRELINSGKKVENEEISKKVGDLMSDEKKGDDKGEEKSEDKGGGDKGGAKK